MGRERLVKPRLDSCCLRTTFLLICRGEPACKVHFDQVIVPLKLSMADYLFSKSSTSSSAPTSVPSPQHPSQGDTATPTSSPNIPREYNLTVQANSFAEIRSRIQAAPSKGQVHLLHPDGETVQQALDNTKIKNSTLTCLISAYIDHTETAYQLCLRLHRCILRARVMYDPLLDDSDPSHCDRAFDLLLDFDTHDNPFPDSHDSSNDVRTCLSDLKNQLDFRVSKSLSRIRFFQCAASGSSLCFIATVVGVAAAAVAVTIHTILALAAAAAPICSAYIPHPSSAAERREIAKLAQLDAAAKGAYVLNCDLDTIDRLVARLHPTVEGDKLLVRLGLERGRERYYAQEVLKLLCKNHESVIHQLEDLEEHICLCIYTVNKARLLLLQEIYNQHTS